MLKILSLTNYLVVGFSIVLLAVVCFHLSISVAKADDDAPPSTTFVDWPATDLGTYYPTLSSTYSPTETNVQTSSEGWIYGNVVDNECEITVRSLRSLPSGQIPVAVSTAYDPNACALYVKKGYDTTSTRPVAQPAVSKDFAWFSKMDLRSAEFFGDLLATSETYIEGNSGTNSNGDPIVTKCAGSMRTAEYQGFYRKSLTRSVRYENSGDSCRTLLKALFIHNSYFTDLCVNNFKVYYNITQQKLRMYSDGSAELDTTYRINTPDKTVHTACLSRFRVNVSGPIWAK